MFYRTQLLLFVVIFLMWTGHALAAGPLPLDMGDRFPEIPMPMPAESWDREYLGLKEGETFTLSQVKADVVLVEFLNVLCPHCQQQARDYNKLFGMIEDDPEVGGRIKMLGVAVANSDAKIEDFIDLYGVDFPITSDRSFTLHRAIGGGQTPLTLYVMQDQVGTPGMVAGRHLGRDRDMEDLFDYLKDLTEESIAEYENLPKEAPEIVEVKAVMPEDMLLSKVRMALDFNGTGIKGLIPLRLQSERKVFTAISGEGDAARRVFAEMTSRSSICDVCHNVHFIYVFDVKGRILAFEPVLLTKYGNVDWSDAEAEKMRRRVVGKYLAGPWAFDPELDAVSQATMTSAIIFDSLSLGRELMQELKDLNLLSRK